MSRNLDVYFGDQKTGVLAQDEAGILTYSYAQEYLASARPQAISVSMPLRDEPFSDRVARPYFSGLLPDERARRRLASALGVSAENPFGLLEIIGGECAGALSLYPAGETPPIFDDAEIEELDESRLETILAKLRARPLLGGEEGVRLSLAGAQDKLAVCIHDGIIGLAKGGHPTTHILKPFIETLDGTVENELFCMRLAARMRLTAPDVSMRTVGKTSFLVVERYDRTKSATGEITRIHQEDFCQALSVPPELKYEDEGGPGIQQSLELIGRSTARPAAERLTFVRMVIFHYLVGNADAHAKNYALLYRDRIPDLAPVYDVLCTTAYPRIAKKLAMAIGHRSMPDTIQLEHWLSIAQNTAGARRLFERELREMASTIRVESDRLLAEFGEEKITHPILNAVRKVIETRSTHLLNVTKQKTS